MNKLILLLLLWSTSAFSQNFAPAPGIEGSTAIHKDSSIISGWAVNINLRRGYLDIAEPSLGFASYGIESDGLIAEGDALSVVSLGDSGEAILTFNTAIFDGPGPDFAVFENGFTDHYMEFAHVEVSSDGVNYVRFPSVSETPLIPQMTNFTFGNCGYIHNLAGKYRQGFGTPFDLNELIGTNGLDVNNITHVKLIDVIGSTAITNGSTDASGNLINDPYPTAFDSGGFDLDGIGVIHSAPLEILEVENVLTLYPNPAKGFFKISHENNLSVRILDHSGKTILEPIQHDDQTFLVGDLTPGIYFVEVHTSGKREIHKLIVL
jgi:hypothetical protein